MINNVNVIKAEIYTDENCANVTTFKLLHPVCDKATTPNTADVWDLSGRAKLALAQYVSIIFDLCLLFTRLWTWSESIRPVWTRMSGQRKLRCDEVNLHSGGRRLLKHLLGELEHRLPLTWKHTQDTGHRERVRDESRWSNTQKNAPVWEAVWKGWHFWLENNMNLIS